MHGTSHDEDPRGGSRTAEAARTLLRALRDDIAALLRRGRQNLSALLGRSRDRLRPVNFRAAPARAWASLRSAAGALQFGRSTGRVLSRASVWVLVLIIAGSLTLAASTLWALQGWPAGKPTHETGKPTLLLQAHNGEALGRIGVLKLRDAEDFPSHLIAAVLAIEDHRFYVHVGVDPIGITRALFRNIESGGIVEGGSTITQQLIKIKYLGHERRYARKLREAVMAVVYERRHGKDEILAEYLNSVYLGDGAYGMPAAARLYFGKPMSELTLAEAAMLAGMIKSPSRHNPIRDLEAAQARAGVVIDSMLEHGMIDESAAREAKAHPATLHQPVGTARARSWFTDWASREATGLADVYTQTMRVRTTLVPELQRLAEQVVEEVLAKDGAGSDASQAALVAMRPDGAVVAMVGGRDYEKSQFNRAAEANRHPGSAFKLFVYLAALRKGYSPHDTIDARPLSIKGWTPENYDGRGYGAVTLADGFSRSVNTAAVRLAMQVGLDNVIDAARDLGIDAPLEPYPSLALGATGVSLVDLTGAFASVRAGRRVEPWGIAALGTGTQSDLRAVGGSVSDGAALGPERDAMIGLLRRVVESGTGRRAGLAGFAAGKTGTSQDYRDAWFVGFNEALVVGVWVGNDDNSPMKRVVGGGLPATIWQRFTAEATGLIAQDQPPMAAPSPGMPQWLEGVFARATEGELNESAPFGGDEEASIGSCDIAACSRAYRSFRAEDCTYQPYNGPRRVCTRGSPGDETETAARPDGPPQRARERTIRPVVRRLFRILGVH